MVECEAWPGPVVGPVVVVVAEDQVECLVEVDDELQLVQQLVAAAEHLCRHQAALLLAVPSTCNVLQRPVASHRVACVRGVVRQQRVGEHEHLVLHISQHTVQPKQDVTEE